MQTCFLILHFNKLGEHNILFWNFDACVFSLFLMFINQMIDLENCQVSFICKVPIDNRSDPRALLKQV